MNYHRLLLLFKISMPRAEVEIWDDIFIMKIDIFEDFPEYFTIYQLVGDKHLMFALHIRGKSMCCV